MATPNSAMKRPKPSLRVATNITARSTRLASYVNPKSPTAFNTLSNVYVTAIERSTPLQAEPVTAIRLADAGDSVLMAKPEASSRPITYPETPLTAHPVSSPISQEMVIPSLMNATPPLSAGPVDNKDARTFSFPSQAPMAASIMSVTSPIAAVHPLRRNTYNNTKTEPPYTHPRSLHSILRNSPLITAGPSASKAIPTSSATPPSPSALPSPRRVSLRLQEKAARRVAYNSPLTQEITTQKYTRSHIDLLNEEASPCSPSPATAAPLAVKLTIDTSSASPAGSASTSAGGVVLDAAFAYNGNETLYGGLTPGPFEEMRRRMAGLKTETPSTPSGPGTPTGIRKKKRKEKKRRWEWTLAPIGDVTGSPATAGAPTNSASGGSMPLTPAPGAFDAMDVDQDSRPWDGRQLV